MARKKISKRQRVIAYLGDHPEAPNLEVTNALSSYDVKYGDVTSVRNTMRKKAESGTAEGTESTADGDAAPKKRRGRPPRVGGATKTSKSASKAATRKVGKTAASTAATESMEALEAGLTFIRSAGSIEEAEKVLAVIRTVRES